MKSARKIITASSRTLTAKWAAFWVNGNPPLEELFDLKKYPLEGHNLADDSKHAEELGQLQSRWKQYQKELK